MSVKMSLVNVHGCRMMEQQKGNKFVLIDLYPSGHHIFSSISFLSLFGIFDLPPSFGFLRICFSISISASLCTSVRVGLVSQRVSMVGVTIHGGVDDILLGGGMFGTVEVLSGLNDVAYANNINGARRVSRKWP